MADTGLALKIIDQPIADGLDGWIHDRVGVSDRRRPRQPIGQGEGDLITHGPGAAEIEPLLLGNGLVDGIGQGRKFLAGRGGFQRQAGGICVVGTDRKKGIGACADSVLTLERSHDLIPQLLSAVGHRCGSNRPTACHRRAHGHRQGAVAGKQPQLAWMVGDGGVQQGGGIEELNQVSPDAVDRIRRGKIATDHGVVEAAGLPSARQDGEGDGVVQAEGSGQGEQAFAGQCTEGLGAFHHGAAFVQQHKGHAVARCKAARQGELKALGHRGGG